MGCTYRIKGKDGAWGKPMSYDELLGNLKYNDSDMERLVDVLFSRTDSQERQAELAESAAVDGDFVEADVGDEKTGTYDFNPRPKASGKVISAADMVDDVRFVAYGEPVTTRMSAKEFVEGAVKAYMNGMGMTREQAQEYAGNVVKYREKVTRDARDFHKLMNMVRTKGRNETLEYADETAFRERAKELFKYEEDLFKKFSYENSPIKAGGRAGRGSVSMSADKYFDVPVRNMGDYETLRTHVDYIAVLEDGTPELYSYVVSPEPVGSWDAAKMDHYRYEMTLAKLAMANKGFDVGKARMHMIPVQIVYDKDFNNVSGVNFGKPVQLDMSEGTYIGDRFENVCSNYVDVAVKDVSFEMADLKEAAADASKCMPDIDIGSRGIAMEAKDWAAENWRFLRIEPRDGGGYRIQMPSGGDVVEVSDVRSGGENEEFVSWLENNIGSGYDPFSGTRGTSNVMADIRKSWERKGNMEPDNILGDLNVVNAKYLRDLFSEYVWNMQRKVGPGGRKTFDYRWEMIDDEALTGANLIGMVNKETNQLDIICLTQHDPGKIYHFEGHKENSNLLGAFKGDDTSPWIPDATWAMIEAERTMHIINHMAESMAAKNYRLGNFKVVCLNPHASRKGAVYSFRFLNEVFDEVIRVVNRETGGRARLENRIRSSGLATMRPELALFQLYRTIRNSWSESNDITFYESLSQYIESHRDKGGMFRPGLVDADTVQVKIELLQNLMGSIRDHLHQKGFYLSDTKEVRETILKRPDSYFGILSRIYRSAGELLAAYTNTWVPDVYEMSTFENYMQRADVITEQNQAMAVRMVQDTYNVLNGRIADWYTDGVKPVFDRMMDESGHNKLKGALIGDTWRVYENMYVLDAEGRNTFMLKNPYDPKSVLMEWERGFLKKILFEFYKVRCRMNNRLLDLEGPEDPTLYRRLPDGYLDLPLMKASKVTSRSNIKSRLGKFRDYLKKMVTDFKGVREDVERSVTDTGSKHAAEQSWREMTVHNRYKEQESYNTRKTMLIEHGADWFETNIENVFIDYLYSQLKSEEFNNLLLKINTLELGIRFRGLDFQNEKEIEKLLEAVDEYTKINVHGGTAMSDESLYVANVVGGLRKLTSEVFFGNNLYGCIRDNIFGLVNGFSEAALKFHTNITADELKDAYAYVLIDCFRDLGSMGLLDRMNLKWGLSSFDYGNISSRLKDHREKGVLLNWQSWIYWTMKAPDFINRMTLLVARMMHDGCFKAYTTDKEGRLVYDWRKDARFDVLARFDRNDTTSFESLSPADRKRYNDQLSLYCNMMRQFNIEMSGIRQLKMTDDLPDAYTNEEMREIKHLGEQLYGAYDKSSRNRLHHWLIGWMFTPYFTWPGGIIDRWGRRTGPSSKRLEEREMRNDKGEPLYWDPKTNDLTTVNTGIPAKEKVRAVDQGIIQTLVTFIKHVSQKGNNLRTYHDQHLMKSPVARRNWKMLAFDMTLFAISSLLLGLVIKPAYKRRKEEGGADPEQVVQNACVELMYRGWARAFDYYSGPFLLVKYFGDSTNPVAYDMGTKLLTDTYKVLAGKNTFGSTLLSYSATYRSVQDSLKMLWREMAEKNPPEWAEPKEPRDYRAVLKV